MGVEGLSMVAFLREITSRLKEATAVAEAALVCAEGGSEREALGIVFEIDQVLHEASVLHGAMVTTKRTRPGSA